MLDQAGSTPFETLPKGSEMVRRTLEFDWGLTEMGPVETWDPALITALRMLLGCPISMCLTWGPARRYFYNDAYIPVLRQRHPEALGSTMEKVWPEIWEQVNALSKQVEAGGSVHEADLLFKIEVNGQITENYFTFAYSPLFSSGGAINGMLCTIIDTTSAMINAQRTRKTEEDLARSLIAVETERVKLRTVLEQVPFSVALLEGPEHRFLFVNQRYRDLFLGGSQADGRTVMDMLPAAREQGYIDLLDSVYAGGERVQGREVNFKFALPDGSEKTVFLDFVYEPVRRADGTIEGILAAINDVTDRVHAVKDIESARREAEVANEAKSAFLANMSHEIRTPLGAILGFTDVLKADLKFATQPSSVAEAAASSVGVSNSEKYLDIITRNGQALIRIIDDILDLSKIEAGKLEIDKAPVDLRHLLRDVIAMFLDRAHEKGIALTFDESGLPEERVATDAARIRQVLVNLIGNALKFTSQGDVQVTCRSATAGLHRQIVFSVRDTGIGMTSEEAARLFRPFTQADHANTRRFGGTGLGLALSRNLALALGGNVEIVACAPNNGSTFEFSFIADRSDLAAVTASSSVRNDSVPPENGETRRPLEGVRVLVTDDSSDNRQLVELYLRKRGATVTQAVDGQNALEIASRAPFDIVLMDIQMPGLDGYGTLAEFRRRGSKTPIIALTAHAMKEEKSRALEAGFVAHVTKPIDAATLVDAISTHVSAVAT